MSNIGYLLLLTFATLLIVNSVNRNTKRGGTSKESVEYNLEAYLEKKKAKRKAGYVKMDSPEMIGEINRQLRTPLDADLPEYKDNYLLEEYVKAKKKARKSYHRNELDFISRGPGNVAGRTRAILVDPKDTSHNTWIAGSASGGIWKTDNAGVSWRNVSQGLPILSTNTLAMSGNNPNVIYAGTGEHFINDTDGNGMFKSIDGGETWFQIADPISQAGFKNVSRIIVDPKDEDVVLAATSNGSWVQSSKYFIWKTIDGGISWTQVYESQIGRIDDLDFNPDNFKTIYAAIRGYGVIKSSDEGSSWFGARKGLSPSGRVEIAISPVDTNRIWASAVGNASGTANDNDPGSDLYASSDGGNSWELMVDTVQSISFLGGQGFYDQIITAHPYHADQVYVGGVNLFKYTYLGESHGQTSYREVEADGTQVFMNFVNGMSYGGGIGPGSLAEEEHKDIEIRFGQGVQMAYRFTVNKQGAEVPFGDFEYEDYVEVPFQVWDVENNRQLMVSFRDQQENGVWDLIERETGSGGPADSREYIFIHDVDYSSEADPNLAIKGGTTFQHMYFLWPYLVSDYVFDSEALPVSNFRITEYSNSSSSSEYVNISDAYNDYDNINTFNNNDFVSQTGMHPDQHGIVIIKESDDEERFRLLITNDGGVYVSKESTNPGIVDGSFNYGGFGYNTSQFYGADKAPGENRYIGGMQDNSTWYTELGDDADSTSRYKFAFGGDGFESIWNNRDANFMIGGIQFNRFVRSTNGGDSWEGATIGFGDGGDRYNSPFISRLANSKSFPDKLYTLSRNGVWISDDFGGNWRNVPITSQWAFNSSMDIEVSPANMNTVWAGGFLSDGLRVFNSIDGGASFNPVNNYDGESLGMVSGIGLHPAENETAYLLFSFAGKPKVIKTTDFGQSWIDISGFEGNGGISDRGFPDVAINSLLVFPNDPNRIWVGSEIGIIESLDGGASWGLLESNMPPVNIHEFKIQDNQIVIATYGRGIWSVDIDGIEQNITFAPAITNAIVDLKQELSLVIEYSDVFDSTQIFVDGLNVGLIDNIQIGTNSQFIEGLDLNREIKVELLSYLNGEMFISPIYILNVFIPSEAIRSYNNDFSDAERTTEFFGNGFRIVLESGFDNEAIHSDHPYPDQTEYTYALTSPYILSEGSTNLMEFDEVVLIEPGEPNTVFGDEKFWDFVVVEGSKDALDWLPLAPGYDSREYATWDINYTSDVDKDDLSLGVGNLNLYEKRTISLSNTFAIGDTVFVRFRLQSDQAARGWGWAIDNVVIGDIESAVDDQTFSSDTRIFPNPTTEHIMIDGTIDIKDAQISIYNLEGKRIRNQIQTELVPSKQLDVSSLPSGAYFLQIKNKDVNEIHKFVKL